MIVIKDKDHNVINIGEWDYKKEMVQIGEEQRTDKKGNPVFEDTYNNKKELISHLPIMDPILEEQTFNPLPDGAYEDEDEVETFEDGSRIAKSDYQKNRLREYPSIVDQLDYIYHNGVAAWKNNMIKPIKDKYEKPQSE